MLILQLKWKGSREAYNCCEDEHKIMRLFGQLQTHKYYSKQQLMAAQFRKEKSKTHLHKVISSPESNYVGEKNNFHIGTNSKRYLNACLIQAHELCLWSWGNDPVWCKSCTTTNALQNWSLQHEISVKIRIIIIRKVWEKYQLQIFLPGKYF